MPDVLPSWVEFHLDFRVVLFSLLVTTSAALAASLAPALQFSKGAIRDVLNDAGPKSSSTRARSRLMTTLLVAEVALAIILLQAGGLVFKAYWQVTEVNPGFRAENVITFALDPPDCGGKCLIPIYDHLLERLRALPGVESVGATTNLPLGPGRGVALLNAARNVRADPAAPYQRFEAQFVVAGYFQAMGIPVLAGRDFDNHDQEAIILNESLARRLWPAEKDIIGRRVESLGRTASSLVVTGLVQDVRIEGLDQEPRPQVYLSWRQAPANQLFVVIQSRRDPAAILALSRDIVHDANPNMALYDVRLMQDRVQRSLWMRRTYSWLLGAFAAMGFLVTVAGIYGVVSYAVAQRRRELAIRMALGARPDQVVSRVLWDGMAAVGLGFAAGLVGGFFAGRALQSLLVSVSAQDGRVIAAVSGLMMGTAFLAMLIPAWRAASINPSQSLRAD